MNCKYEVCVDYKGVTDKLGTMRLLLFINQAVKRCFNKLDKSNDMDNLTGADLSVHSRYLSLV